MRPLFRAVAGAAVAVAAVLTAVVTPSAAASPETVTAAPAGMERRAISGPGYTPPPVPDLPGTRAADQWYGPYTFRNGNSGKCMDILGASKEIGAPAVQYTCVAGGLSQMWWEYMYEMDGFGYSRFIGNNWSGMCLQSSNNNVPLIQLGCAAVHPQIFDSNSSDIMDISQYGNCVEVQGGSKSNFAKIVMWPCHGRAHQLWYRYDA